jgi:hypothetical protein
VSLAYRELKATMSTTALDAINKRIDPRLLAISRSRWPWIKAREPPGTAW